MILRSVDHPNIAKLHEVFLDHNNLHIVTEMLEGGKVDPTKEVEGRDAARIIRQAL